MTNINISLAFYQNHQTARLVLKKLRRSGFYRSISLHRKLDGQLIIDKFLFVDSQIIKKYKDCVVRGETLIIAQVKEKDIREIFHTLQMVEGDHPISFLFFADPLWEKIDSSDFLKDPLDLEQLQKHASELAHTMKDVIYSSGREQPLKKRLHTCARVLESIRHRVIEAEHIEQTLTLSAEWLLDNTHVIEENIEEVERSLPQKYYQKLPKLKGGNFEKLPRIYAIAAEIVGSTANRLNHQKITSFLTSYLTVDFLTIGELWALPLMLRLRLLESMQNLAIHLDRRIREGELGRYWGNRLLNIAKREPERLNFVFVNLKESIPNPSLSFAVALVEHLFDEDVGLSLVKIWLEEYFALNINEIMQKNQIQETKDEAAFSSAVISLNTISQLSWKDIFEKTSQVDAILNNDPAGVYSNMDFGTRDRYRHSVEVLSRLSKKNEVEIAQKILDLSKAGDNEISRHVGYYLVDRGRPILEDLLESQPTWSQWFHRWMNANSTLFYLGAIGSITAVLECFLFFHSDRSLLAVFLMFLSLFPVSEIGIQFVNLIIPYLVPPNILPKMSFEKGIPEEFKTLVVVPSLLSTVDSVSEMLHSLETHYLTNMDASLKFGLLFDFRDAPMAAMKEDAELSEAALNGIQALEEKHGQGKFFLFIRERVWSESEMSWIGWERKRGKLECLNRFLTDSSYPRDMLRFGRQEDLNQIRYVITLDADTQLPKDKARQMVETIAHPLNRVEINADNTIQRGFTIIQPRVSTTLSQIGKTLFQQIFSDVIGVDPYTQAISDVYQDLMKEGTYHGKGIYDLKAFNRVLTGKFPEEHLLSHDLLEGIHARVGYASDIGLFDEFPDNYLSWSQRQHRWMRGDWQIIDWLFSKGHNISILNRWKIFDNLRRALLLPAIFLLLIVTWLYSEHFFLWTGFGIGVLFIPTFFILLSPTLHYKLNQFITRISRVIITIMLLPHQAKISMDAFFRVFYRRCFSHRHLLQWSVANQNLKQSIHTSFLISLGWISLFSVALAITIWILNPDSFYLALPFCILWTCSPFIVAILDDKKLIKDIYQKELSDNDRKLLRRIGRKTWRYFDDFVGPQSNWLPPDNYQASLSVEVAQRTSPTNIGLWMLSVVSANDLKYITCDDAIDYLTATFKTIKKLELHNGHLLNWYEIQTLKPLLPRYVSTVDNGNLLASLWTLEQAIHEMIAAPIFPLSFVDGLQDTFELLCENDHTDFSELKKIIYLKPRNLLEAFVIVDAALKCIQDMGGKQHYWLTQLEKQLKAWNIVRHRYFTWMEIYSEIPHEDQQVLHSNPSLIDLASGKFNINLKTLPDDEWSNRLKESFHNPQWFAGEKLGQAQMLINETRQITQSTDMRFLYNPERRLFSIGFHVDDFKLDNSYYDLLASEARVASLVAIAKNEVPLEHWWSLGRPYRIVNNKKVLVSWGGTMFEYLMPLLFMKNYRDSALGSACENAVFCQIQYGKKRGFPWGISESAFSEIDIRKTYQYRSFGVPGLGFKRDLEEDLVVSPYSSFLALMVNPSAAIENIQNLTKNNHNLYNSYGYYESVDFSRAYGPHGKRGIIVYAYMAHHQGMSLISINNVLNDSIMPQRFHNDPRINGVESLLFERPPIKPAITKGYRREIPLAILRPFSSVPITGMIDTPHTSTPQVNLLSNRIYSVMVTNTGGGYSKWDDIDITRWYSDTTCDSLGSYCYIKDLQSKQFWSSTFQPTYINGERFSAQFKSDKAEFKRRDHLIETITEIVVSPEDNVEVRIITLANLSNSTRHLELTSYMELALAPHNTDRIHPSFNKMFIQTEAVPEINGLLAFRRLRSNEDKPIWAAHIIASDQNPDEKFQFETDRALFIGRGNTLSSPDALRGELTNSQGYVLDPIFSLRQHVILKPGGRVQVSLITAISEDRNRSIELITKYKDIAASRRTLDLAWTYAQLEMRHLQIHQEEAQLFQRLAGHILYPHSHMRILTERLRKNRLGKPRLWSFGISGDIPILALTVTDFPELDVVKQILTAHAFWRMRGLKVDLVILNEEAVGYENPLFQQLNRMTHGQSYGSEIGKPGGIFLFNTHQIPEEEVILILFSASANLVATRGMLRQHLTSHVETTSYPSHLVVKKGPPDFPSKPLPFLELPYFNGVGGFTQDGKEYVIYLGPNEHAPAPWVNVIGNSQLGAIVTETGLGASWYGNSQTNRLTSWSNDPLLNPINDTIYIRDNELGTFWTPTPSPIRELDAYRTRHGQGYTCFEHNSHGIEQNLLIFIPVNDNEGPPIRVQRLTLTNNSSRKRILSLFSFSELVLGTNREETHMHIMTQWDQESQSIFARNYYNADFANYVAFASSNPTPSSHTGNRREFIGRNHHASNPAALKRKSLSNQTGGGIDPCAALHINIELNPGEQKEAIFILGYASDEESARKLSLQCQDTNWINQIFTTTKSWWDDRLETIQVDCPELYINFALNRWLVYQTLSCRIWGRSGFYQSSGAYGFRDQLQDVLALLYADPQIARTQILRSASRQFVEGDVQHWWLPPTNAGVRTRISDDLLWLTFVTAQYVRVTNDTSILNEVVPFIKGDLLNEGQDDSFFTPEISTEQATLLEHCRRALIKGFTKGPHGLPLIGSGDWNDGMNRVGKDGKGESVWLGWFLIHALNDFSYLLTVNGNDEAGKPYQKQAKELAKIIEDNSWDGKWYRRAYFDDGTPLGSITNQEDSIDSLPQSWAVICGAAQPDRTTLALNSVEEQLIRQKEQIILLLTPPFDKTSLDPGYIKAYPPGVRENGGQYTHGSLWVALAYARLKEGDKAVNCLQMMHPITHSRNLEEARRYKIEPYAIAGDVYSLKGKEGCGGWSWYTGASAWMYRIWIEEVLGFKLTGTILTFDPSLPKNWDRVKMNFKHKSSRYEITIENPNHLQDGKIQINLDGSLLEDNKIHLVNDGNTHTIQVLKVLR